MMERYLRAIDREKGGQCVFHPLSPAAINSTGFLEEMFCWLSELSFKDIPKGRCIFLRGLANWVREPVATMLIAAVILLLCLGTAMIATVSFRRQVSEPIVALAEMSRKVSRDRNYSLRAPPSRDRDEVSVLIDAFNEMLAQIEQRDIALRHAKDELEERVQERTAELKTAVRELEAFSYTVAHDLRGPLDAVSGIGFVLQKDYANTMDADGQEMLQSLRNSSTRMATLIDDLLNLLALGRRDWNGLRSI